jgi:hypothetical protein
MASIGNSPTQQAFTPAIDYFSGNGSTTAFTLSRPVASVAQVQVVIDNVAQNPSSAYTVSANTITFTSAPLSGTNNIYVYYTSPITQVIAPGQGTVNTTALGNITNIASGNSSLTLQTGSGNTTAITVDTSQNVGIGTTSPTAKLDIRGGVFVIPSAGWSSGNTATINLGDSGNGWSCPYGLINTLSAYNGLAFSTSNSERMRIDTSGRLLLGTTATPSGGGVNLDIVGQGSSDSGIQITAGTGASGGGLAIISNATGGGKFYTFTGNTGSEAYTERMRIDSSGKLLLNTTSVISGSGAQMSIFFPGDSIWGIGIQTTYTPVGSRFLLFKNSAGTEIGYINQNATTTVNYSTSSDYRLKENIAPMTGALTKVAQLKPVTYKWKADGSDGQGFIAHELAEVVPDCVSGDKDELYKNGDPKYQGVDTSFLVATLTAAIQELKAINDTQAETINALTARIEALENR